MGSGGEESRGQAARERALWHLGSQHRALQGPTVQQSVFPMGHILGFAGHEDREWGSEANLAGFSLIQVLSVGEMGSQEGLGVGREAGGPGGDP